MLCMGFGLMVEAGTCLDPTETIGMDGLIINTVEVNVLSCGGHFQLLNL